MFRGEVTDVCHGLRNTLKTASWAGGWQGGRGEGQLSQRAHRANADSEHMGVHCTILLDLLYVKFS